jgi:hypothetical protein
MGVVLLWFPDTARLHPADDPEVGKIGILALALLLLGTSRCYANTDWDNAKIPFLSGGGGTATPESVGAIGKPADAALPETDFAKWFSTDATADPYDPAVWKAVDAFFASASTSAGWADACKKAGAVAGAERTARPEIGALACSDNANVTLIQRFALQLLGVRAEVALWVRGVPGHGTAGIEGRQGELRLMCAVDVVGREGGTASPFAEACTKSLDQSYRAGGAASTFIALGQAYAVVAAEIARRDPTVDAEPVTFADPKTP